MNKILRKISILLIVLLVLVAGTCYATSGEVVSNSSGENIYIDNLEDYDELTSNDSGYTQAQLKDYYEYYMSTYNEHLEKEYVRATTTKARVTSAGELRERYELNAGYQDDQYYSIPIKYYIQKIEVEILEGEYIGQKFEIEYIPNGDMLNNVSYSKLKKGDTVFVVISLDEETEEVVVQLSEDGANIERFGIVVCVGIIAAILLALYAGKKGIIAFLISILALVFCVIIIPSTYAVSSGFIISGICLIGLIIALVCLHTLGISKNALKAGIISLLMTIFTLLITIAINYLTRVTGVTLEAIAFSNLTLVSNVNMESLYVMITLIISSFAISNIVCKIISRLMKSESKTFNEKINECKDILSSNVLMIVVTILALYIPNHLYLLTNRYTNLEICNSETFMSEIIRMLVIILAMTISMPLTVFFDEDKK